MITHVFRSQNEGPGKRDYYQETPTGLFDDQNHGIDRRRTATYAGHRGNRSQLEEGVFTMASSSNHCSFGLTLSKSPPQRNRGLGSQWRGSDRVHVQLQKEEHSS